MAKNSGQTHRDLLGNNGKGDADRTTNHDALAEGYDNIAWPRDNSGFEKSGPRQVKTYGTRKPKTDGKGPRIIIH